MLFYKERDKQIRLYVNTAVYSCHIATRPQSLQQMGVITPTATFTMQQLRCRALAELFG
jgi:hypothetical protein